MICARPPWPEATLAPLSLSQRDGLRCRIGKSRTLRQGLGLRIERLRLSQAVSAHVRIAGADAANLEPGGRNFDRRFWAPIDNGKIDVAGLTFPVRGGIYASYAAADGQTSAEMVLPGSLLVGAERGDIASLMELRAITTTTIAQLSADQISVLIGKHPDFGRRLFLAASRSGGRQRNARLELSFTDATSRFAKLLLRLESSFGQHLGPSSWVEHGLTQTHLANLVSARRETINKAIAEFVRRDWIAVDGTSFLLLDRDRLQSRAR